MVSLISQDGQSLNIDLSERDNINIIPDATGDSKSVIPDLSDVMATNCMSL